MWERIRENWQALKRERIGKEAVAEWYAAVLTDRLRAMMAGSEVAAVRP